MAETKRVTKNLRDAVITLEDASEPIKSITLAIEEGDFSFEETNNVNNILDRGSLSHMRRGDEAPIPITYGLKFREAISEGDNPITPYEFVNKTGNGSALVSTNDDGGDVDTHRIKLLIKSPTAGESDELYIFEKVHGEWAFNEGDEYNTLAFEGEDFETRPTISKVAES